MTPYDYSRTFKITEFAKEFHFLSNFYDTPIVYNDLKWYTAEAAYQAMKSLSPSVHAEMAKERNPAKLKSLGKHITIRHDWEFIKVQIMSDIVAAKFDQNPDLKQRLLDTGFCMIEEGNDWGDTTWGVSPAGSNTGKNYLGIILMKLRQRYIDELPYTPGNIYTGIGSRDTPDNILQDMEHLAAIAGNNGWLLRSGGAVGADTAFELGAAQSNGAREIYLPWAQFNGSYSPYTCPSPEAYRVASEIHPRWDYLNPSKQSLVARNMHQVIGDFSAFPPVRSKCVVCWTPDGCEKAVEYGRTTGGTGTAIYLADSLGIPVFNLKKPGRLEDVYNFMFAPDSQQEDPSDE